MAVLVGESEGRLPTAQQRAVEQQLVNRGLPCRMELQVQEETSLFIGVYTQTPRRLHKGLVYQYIRSDDLVLVCEYTPL